MRSRVIGPSRKTYWFVATLLLLSVPARAPAQAALHALVISCTDYVTPQNNKIRDSCLVDRQLVLNALALVETQGWGRVKVHDLHGRAATGDALRSALRSTKEHAGADDTLLVYFTGHGFVDSAGTGARLLCSDETSVARAELVEELRQARCRLKVLITDCCSTYFRMPAARLENAGDSGITQPISRSLLFGHRGFTDLTAASPGQAAYATEMGGYFTSWLIGLASCNENLTWQVLFDQTRQHVRDQVQERHGLDQEPRATSIAEPEKASPSSGRMYSVVGVRQGNHLIIREGPGREHHEVARIPSGSRGVPGTGREQAGWIEVRHADRQGWCSREYLSSDGDAGIPAALHATTYRVRQVPIGQHLNVRSEPMRPARDDNILDQIPHDGRGLVRIDGPRDGWIKIRSPQGGHDVSGWVRLEFVEPDDPSAYVPSAP